MEHMGLEKTTKFKRNTTIFFSIRNFYVQNPGTKQMILGEFHQNEDGTSAISDHAIKSWNFTLPKTNI